MTARARPAERRGSWHREPLSTPVPLARRLTRERSQLVISFVCSRGNVPLTAALWPGDISFGGVVVLVFADLITLPLLLIYGAAITLRIQATFSAVTSVAGLAVEYLIRSLGIPVPKRPAMVVPTGIRMELHQRPQHRRADRI